MYKHFKTISDSVHASYLESDLTFNSYGFYHALFPLANHVTRKVTLSQTDIASELKLSKQCVSQYLAKLSFAEWITYDPKQGSHQSQPIKLLKGWWDDEKGNEEKVEQIPGQEGYEKIVHDTPLSSVCHASVKPHTQKSTMSVDRALTEDGQRIVETPVTVDVERSASVNQLTTEIKSTDHGPAGSVLFNPVEEGKEGNDKEGDELSELDKRALLIWDEEFIQDELWTEMNEDEKLNLVVSFENDDPTYLGQQADIDKAEQDSVDEDYQFPIPCPVCNNPLVYKRGRVNCTDCDWSFGYRVFKKRLMPELDDDNSFPADVAAQNRGDLSRLLGGLTVGEDAVVVEAGNNQPVKRSMEETLRRLRRMDLSAGITYKEDS